MTPHVATSARIAGLDAAGADMVHRLLGVAVRGLPLMQAPGSAQFAFTRTGSPAPAVRGTSCRYTAIVALGVHLLPEAAQRAVLGGRCAAELVDVLVRDVARIRNLGDAALVCWAAAQTGHPDLPAVLRAVGELDDAQPAQYVVETSWLISALAAARPYAGVEERLSRARARLLAGRRAGSPLFPHATDPQLLPWYRSHVGSFADQVYPIQALARLHAAGDDPEALAAATACAARICRLQGAAGEWWWHYDARTGGLVEEYPVYSVHQHAMAPMALLDLAEAAGASDPGAALRTDAIARGLAWLDRPAGDGPMIREDLGLIWRKVHRGDRRKVARAVNGVSTRIAAGRRPVGRRWRADAVDFECRPYELGWLLFAWLGGLPGGAR